MKAKNFDKKFDQGKEDIIKYLDLSSLKRPTQTPRRVNVDFPEWMISFWTGRRLAWGLRVNPLSKFGLQDALNRRLTSKGCGRFHRRSFRRYVARVAS